MSKGNKILNIILYVVTVLGIAIDIFDFVTKGTVSTLYLLATAACICACVATLFENKKKK